METLQSLKIVILSTADFAAPLWTNKQHLANGLSSRCDVIYIESLGLRSPTFNWTDLSRIFVFLLPKKSTQGNHGIKVIKPWVIPFHKFLLIRSLNHVLMRLFAFSKFRNIRDATLWSFSPVTYGLENYFKTVVYHSVDILEHFPGVPSDLILKSEKKILDIANISVVSSRTILDKLRTKTEKDIVLLENVADTNVFINYGAERSSSVVFAGNLSPHKIDFDLIEELAKTGIDIKLAGTLSIDGGDSERIRSIIFNFSNVNYLGKLTPGELNVLFNKCKVGIIPYLCNDHTAGIYPMKVHEYGAAGLSTVSTPLPSLITSDEIPGLSCTSPANFVDEVMRQINLFTREYSHTISTYSNNRSWKNRITEVIDLLERLNEI